MNDQEEQLLWNSGVLTLFGEVDNVMAQGATEFILAQNFRSSKTRPSHITLIINSEGGSLSDAFAIIDIVSGSSLPVHTLGLGQISSAGLMIFMAGHRGQRTLTANTSIMSHQWSGDVSGKMHELVSLQQDFAQTSQRMIRHYQTCSGLDEDTVRQKLLPPHDVYLTAQQAVELGIADRIQE